MTRKIMTCRDFGESKKYWSPIFVIKFILKDIFVFLCQQSIYKLYSRELFSF